MAEKDYFIIGILSIFSVFSILFQLKNKAPLRKIGSWDTWGLLPYYCFFAPSPLTSDFRILYRITGQKSKTDFKEVVIYTPKKWYRSLYGSGKYYSKGLVDLCIGIMEEYKKLKKDSKSLIQISSNYTGILNAIIGTIKPQDRFCYDENDEIEFSIIATQDKNAGRTMDVVFRSFKHKLL